MTKKMKIFYFIFHLLILQRVYSNSIINCQLGENCFEEEVKKSEFPDGFLFGTSTSAYQVLHTSFTFNFCCLVIEFIDPSLKNSKYVSLAVYIKSIFLIKINIVCSDISCVF